MRKFIAAAAIAAASAATSACGGMHNESGGPTVSRNFQIANFQEIEVAGPYDVTVRTGGNPGVTAQGSEKLLDRTSVKVEDNKLVIRPEHSGMFSWNMGGKANFTVTVPQLNGATIAGSGDIHVDKVAGQDFSGKVAGSGGLDIGALEVQSLKLAIGGSGNIKTGAGKAEWGDYAIGGSGDIDASGVQTQQAKVSIAGSGGVKANASGTADVTIMGAGDVDVAGGAKCNVNKTGSGNVRCS